MSASGRSLIGCGSQCGRGRSPRSLSAASFHESASRWRDERGKQIEAKSEGERQQREERARSPSKGRRFNPTLHLQTLQRFGLLTDARRVKIAAKTKRRKKTRK